MKWFDITDEAKNQMTRMMEKHQEIMELASLSRGVVVQDSSTIGVL